MRRIKRSNLQKTIAGITVAMLAILLPVLAAVPTRAAERKINLTGRVDGYSSVLYDNSNGLPTTKSNAIVQTQEGFI